MSEWVYKITGSGRPPVRVQFRYCPKDPGHWRTDGERCPACGSKIAVKEYVSTGPKAVTTGPAGSSLGCQKEEE